MTSAADCVERDRVVQAGVPFEVHDIRPFPDFACRPDYDRETVRLLARFNPDLVILCGYLHIVTSPLLEAYPDRVINIHDSDLALVNEQGRPRYPGLHATRDAIFAGERETRTSIHMVTPEVDGGPLLLRSRAFATHPLVHAARRWGATDILKAYAYAQREWMMREAWGPLLTRAIDLAAQGDLLTNDAHALAER
jgi:folate-dependent phosphoribosylglycinamide formyltransferase PurN